MGARAVHPREAPAPTPALVPAAPAPAPAPAPAHAAPPVHHERQRWWRCGLHAVNALLHAPVYSPRDFERLADDLLTAPRPPWAHPHRSVLGLGNYDLNVLMSALHRRGLDVSWLPQTRSVRDVLRAEERLSGFLVNVPGSWQPPWPLSHFLVERRHWIAVTRYGPHFYLVDSNQPAPTRFESESDLLSYFASAKNESRHVLYVCAIPPASSPG